MSDLLIGRPVAGLRKFKRVKCYAKGVKLIEKKRYSLIALNLEDIELNVEQVRELFELLDRKNAPTLIISEQAEILSKGKDYLETLAPGLVPHLLKEVGEKLDELRRVREEFAQGFIKSHISKFTNLFRAAKRATLKELVLIRVGEEVFEATLANISETGALIETRANLRVLEHLDVTIHHGGELSKVAAFVVRSQQGLIEGNAKLTGFGLRFHFENRSGKRRLKNYLSAKLAS